MSQTMKNSTYGQAYNKQIKDYQAMQVLSAKPEKLILMLYDGALKFMTLGMEGIEQKNLEKAHNNLIKAQRIFLELMTSLDFKKGGEIASNLFRIYEFMHHTLVNANVKKEAEPVLKVSEQLRTLRDSWEKAMKSQWNGLPEGLEKSSPAAQLQGETEQAHKRFEFKG